MTYFDMTRNVVHDIIKKDFSDDLKHLLNNVETLYKPMPRIQIYYPLVESDFIHTMTGGVSNGFLYWVWICC